MTLVALESVPRSWLPQTQTWLYEQIRRLPESVETHVICREVQNLDQFPHPRVHVDRDQSIAKRLVEVPLRALRVRRYRGLLTECGRRHGAALLHSHFGPHAWNNRGAAERLGIPHLVTFYGYDVNLTPSTQPKWRKRYEQLFTQVSGVLCEGPHMANCIRDLGCPPEKVQVHRLGVDLEKLPFLARDWSGDRPLRVLIAAAFREKKGIPLAIRALATIKDRTDLQVTVVGEATPTPASQSERQRILETVEKCGMAEWVSFQGFQTHKRLLNMARDHDLFVSPSLTASNGDTEGGAPVGLIEMASTGIVVVSSDHCDIPEVIVDGQTGFLSPEGNLDGLVYALEKALKLADEWPALGLRSREHITSRFDSRVQGQQLGATYARVVDGASA